MPSPASLQQALDRETQERARVSGLRSATPDELQLIAEALDAGAMIYGWAGYFSGERKGLPVRWEGTYVGTLADDPVVVANADALAARRDAFLARCEKPSGDLHQVCLRVQAARDARAFNLVRAA